MTKPAMIQMPLGKIPRGLLSEITSWVKSYAVGLFAVDGAIEHERIRYCGSGTFVTALERFYVLTAAHVWEALKSSSRIGLVLTEYESRFVIQTTLINTTVVGKRRSPAWGPDLAFLAVPLADLPRIRVHKTFYDLLHPMRIAQRSTDRGVGLWAFVGAPAEQSDIRPAYAELRAGVHFSRVDAIHNRSGFDYIDIGVNAASPEAPRSFGGVSGGGLWHLVLERNVVGHKRTWRWANTLKGVAFYESPVRDGRRIVRCHGPRSIYEKGLDSLALPNRMQATAGGLGRGGKSRRAHAHRA